MATKQILQHRLSGLAGCAPNLRSVQRAVQRRQADLSLLDQHWPLLSAHLHALHCAAADLISRKGM